MIRGCCFYSQKCKKCGKLICGESEASRDKAKRDYDRKMNLHHNEKHKPKAKPQLAIEKVEGK